MALTPEDFVRDGDWIWNSHVTLRSAVDIVIHPTTGERWLRARLASLMGEPVGGMMVLRRLRDDSIKGRAIECQEVHYALRDKIEKSLGTKT